MMVGTPLNLLSMFRSILALSCDGGCRHEINHHSRSLENSDLGCCYMSLSDHDRVKAVRACVGAEGTGLFEVQMTPLSVSAR